MTTITTTLLTKNADRQRFDRGLTSQQVQVDWWAVSCPNPGCRETEFVIQLFNRDPVSGYTELLREWRLMPSSRARVFPEYIPEAIRSDYEEACAIETLSPKGSATLSRRCLQGMIRDFWEVTGKPNLYQEIEAIKDKVDGLTWDAIESVRTVGNIGAHMEKDVNVIIDVDPQEAAMLIWLIELLLEQWYVGRHEREARLAEVKQMADAKQAAKTAPEPS